MVYLNLYAVDLKSWPSIAIAIATRSIYTHANIQVGEEDIFDASGHANIVGWRKVKAYSHRPVRQIKLGITENKAREILEQYNGLKYDHTALKLWAFGIQDELKVYCFEVCWAFLAEGFMLKPSAPSRLKRYTANKILKFVSPINPTIGK